MAKNFRCWVIVVGSESTAFRARLAEDLLPTLKQLQRTQPNVEMKWFERGRLWPSPEAAVAALKERRRAPSHGERGRDWRPGGDHKDPRAKYDIPRDEKRARFKKQLIAKKTRAGAGEATSRPPSDRPPYRPSGAPPHRRFSGSSSRSPGSPPRFDKPRGQTSRRPPSGGGRPPKRRSDK